jgi:hypothetical protein
MFQYWSGTGGCCGGVRLSGMNEHTYENISSLPISFRTGTENYGTDEYEIRTAPEEWNEYREMKISFKGKIKRKFMPIFSIISGLVQMIQVY